MALLTRIQSLAAPLSRPWVVLVSLPVLMLAVVVFFVLGTESALLGLAGQANRARLQAHNQALAEAAKGLTQRAEDLMPSMRSTARRYMEVGSDQELARRLTDLLQASEGVAWLIIAFPDGRFRAAFRDHERDHAIHFTRRHPQTGGEILTIDQADELHQVATNPDLRYDPRQRDFWSLAEDHKDLVWSEPYLFFTDQVPGISCVQALRDEQGAIQAVLAVDVDLFSLSQSLSSNVVHPQARALLMAGEQVLAAVLPDGGGLPQGESLPALADFADPVLQSYDGLRDGKGDVLSFLVPNQQGAEVEFMVEDLTYAGPRQQWRVAQFYPRSVIEAPVRSTVEQSRLVAVVGAGVAMVLAIIYAWALVDANRRIRRAEAGEAKARADMRQIGAYYLVRLLGAGGMGAVWLARHHFLAKPAAMKFILPEAQSVDEHSVQRFKDEARILANLQSLHTIRVYDFGQTPDRRLFYVMEMLDGVDLDHLVEDYGPQPAARVLTIMRQCCASLGEAHQQGLVHRDIKPGNIFLCRMANELDIVKILDFGLATSVSKNKRITQAGMVQGTPEFMAPEQAQDEAVDGRADIYALGCVAYWLLTGQPPFTAGNPMAILLQHINDEPPNLTMSAGRSVPLSMETLIHWCLAKDPSRRPQTAEELLAALSELELPGDDWNSKDCAAWWAQIPRPDYAIEESDKLTTGEAIMVHGPLSER